MFNLEDLINELEKKGIRYLLIGGQAVTIYGSPLVSFDFDFWIDPTQRKDFFKIADSLDFEYGEDIKNKPLVVFYAEEEKIDAFFVKKMSTKGGCSLVFEECYKKAVSLKDPTGFIIHVPNIDDLIALKTCKKKPSAKDLEDIEYLRIIKKKLKKGSI
ncbi:MAG: nucleotidyltransferase [Nitrospirota bacterium]|mgnify:CR=1 FL=1